MIALASSLMSRKVVNAIYFVAPPLGLAFMLVSPSFSMKERMVRGMVTASFLAFFATMGPSLHHYYDTQLAALQAQQQP
jgi:hypothetical protein